MSKPPGLQSCKSAKEASLGVSSNNIKESDRVIHQKSCHPAGFKLGRSVTITSFQSSENRLLNQPDSMMKHGC
jgi:hypothetical protein